MGGNRSQTHRVELNAMTTPQFIEWLDSKMDEHGKGKLIPPADVLEAELARRIDTKVRAALTERILREAGFERQVADTIARSRRRRRQRWRKTSSRCSSGRQIESGVTISRR